MEEKERIKIIDSRCGAGKTSFAIQYINSLPQDTKIIYITPFLKECERIKDSCPAKEFYAPDSRKGKGSKMVNMIDLISKGKNVVSTHALFGNIDDRLINAIRSHDYILILDEVMNVIEKFDLYKEDTRKTDQQKEILTKEDIKVLLDKDIISVDTDTYLVKWNEPGNILNKYIQLKNLADREMLFLMGEELLIWSFPIEVFREGVFEEIFILTYQFDYQIQAYYYKYFDLKYSTYVVKETAKRKYQIFPLEENKDYDLEWRKQIRGLINICDDHKLNRVGSYYYDANNRLTTSALSKSWYNNADPATIRNLVQNIINFVQNKAKSKSNERMWTCFKAHKNIIKNNNLSAKNWIELNARATNDYANKTTLVYPINRFLNPFFITFFSKKGISLDQDLYALSELIQWIFRSAIRNNKKINIYIPSERMRNLLIAWLHDQ